MTRQFEQNIWLHKIRFGVLNRNLVAMKNHLPIFSVLRRRREQSFAGNEPSSREFEAAQRMRVIDLAA
jgi:hypothetical protein